MSRKKGNGEGSIYTTVRNGKTYYTAQITIGTEPNGKPLRKSFSGYKKSDVLEKMRSAQVQVDKGLYIPDSEMEFAEFFQMWLFTFKKHSIKPTSFARYEQIYRNKIKDSSIAHIKLTNLSALKLQKYFNDMLESGNLTPNSAKVVLTRINTCLKYAVQEGIIYRNYAANIQLPEIIQQKKRTAYEKDEQEAILNYLTDDICDIAILLDFCTGMRLGELLAIRTEFIDFKNCEIHVNDQYQYVYEYDAEGNKKREYKLIPPKTKTSNRIIPIPSSVMKKISDIVNNRPVPIKNPTLIFCDTSGKPLNPKKVTRRLEHIEKKLNIEHKNFHAIRHSYATRLFESGVPPKTVQILMGHSNIKPTLDIYTHYMNSAKKDVKNVLNNMFSA